MKSYQIYLYYTPKKVAKNIWIDPCKGSPKSQWNWPERHAAEDSLVQDQLDQQVLSTWESGATADKYLARPHGASRNPQEMRAPQEARYDF